MLLINVLLYITCQVGICYVWRQNVMGNEIVGFVGLKFFFNYL
jgi:hypothetical protein